MQAVLCDLRAQSRLAALRRQRLFQLKFRPAPWFLTTPRTQILIFLVSYRRGVLECVSALSALLSCTLRPLNSDAGLSEPRNTYG